jgi:4-aminobutyrate aminotransferase/(S)-3-amino-2-methylpropionate transaminase
MSTLGALLPHLETAVPGPASALLVDTLAATECPALTLRRARRAERSGAAQDPIVWREASGANVVDADGNRFVDLSAGFGAAAVGHAHPRVVSAVQAQAGRLLHALGDLQPSDVKVALLARLAELAPFSQARVMLGLSGADAVEAALKTALLYTGKPGVVAFEGAYHGLSHGPLAACGYSAAFRAPFAAQLNSHVAFAPYPAADAPLDAVLAAVEHAIDGVQAGVGVVLVEPVLGRGGVIVPPAGFLPGLAALCQRRGVLLAIAEIMTGVGRTGSFLRCTSEGVQPDLLCLGKALGGGLPVSACLGRAEIMQAWGDPGHEALHTGTFFGNPLAAAAALATLDIVQNEKLAERARLMGASLLDALEIVCKRHAAVSGIRGAGLLLGIELRSAAQALGLGRALLSHGYITVPAGADARVVSLTPPLTIAQPQLYGFVAALDACLGALP